MNYHDLHTRFLEIRSKQAESFRKVETKLDQVVTEVIYAATCNAMSNVASGDNRVYMQAVSLGTGMGKTTSACAILAAAALTDPHFSAAYVVPTARIGEEVQQIIEASLGQGSVYLWTSYHDKNSRIEVGRIVEALGHLPARQTMKDGLPMERIVIVTHETLKNEAKHGHEYGVTTYKGRPRNVVFIDESPSVLDIYHTTAEELQGLHHDCSGRNELKFVLPTISTVVARMSEVMEADGYGYLTADLISAAEFEVFSRITTDDIRQLTDDDLSDELRADEGAVVRNLLMFLKAASHGNVFYSKKDRTFFSYQLHLCKTYPGYVLLDATSDLEGLVKLDTGIRSIPVPSASYENLEIYSLDMPKRFNNKIEVTKSRELGRAYAKYIKDMVCANADQESDVLIVLPKILLDQELIEAANNPHEPLNWNGIKVNTQHWGAGVGSNKFRNKSHVFLFGDHVLGRSVTIARAHGWSGVTVDNRVLKDAVERRTTGKRYRPKGMYGSCHDGFQLRWTKQLAMRGTARKIDGEGRANAMKLFTTMSRDLLLDVYSELFPGAPLPKPAQEGVDVLREETKGRQGLKTLLFKGQQAYYSADEIAVELSIPTHRLGREFEAIRNRGEAANWELCKAKNLGKAGRSSFVVNWTRIPGKLHLNDVAKLH
jgi:hypothetical protein